MERRSIFLDVKMDLAESYLFGVAKGNSVSYAINIQGGKPDIVLPRELLDGDPDLNRSAILNIKTLTGNVSLRANVKAGSDMIQIFDDELIERLAVNEPTSMEILLLEEDDQVVG